MTTSSSSTRDNLEIAARWVLGVCIFTGWAVLSFDGWAELGRQVVGWDSQKALLLPLTVDALVAVTFLMAARARETDWALLAVAAGAAMVSLTGNGVAWLYSTGMAVPGPVAVFVVSALAPACGLVFLHLIMRRSSTCSPTQPKTRTDRQAGGVTESTTTPAASSSVASGGSPGARSSGTASTRSRSTAAGAGSRSPSGTRPRQRQQLDERRVRAIAEHGWHGLSQRDLNQQLRALGLGTSYSKLPGLVARAGSNGHRP